MDCGTGDNSESVNLGLETLEEWILSDVQTCELVPHEFLETGRGLKACRTVLPGSVVISVNYKRCISRKTVKLTRGDLPPALCKLPLESLIVFLMIEDVLGEESSFAPYIRCLPRNFTNILYALNGKVPCDEKMPEELRNLLQKQYYELHQSWRLVKQAFTSAELLVWTGACIKPRFTWAWFVVSTRTLHIRPDEVALVPFVDLLNHSPTAQSRTMFNEITNAFEIVTEDRYEAGDQVFINYGSHDNMKLAIYYGFTAPRNPYSNVTLGWTEVTQQLVLSHWKIEFLENYNAKTGLSCSWEGFSYNLKLLARVQGHDKIDWWTLLADDRLPVHRPQIIHGLKIMLLNKLIKISEVTAANDSSLLELIKDICTEQVGILEHNLKMLEQLQSTVDS